MPDRPDTETMRPDADVAEEGDSTNETIGREIVRVWAW